MSLVFALTAEQILYEDQDFIIVNKPEGLATQNTENPKAQSLYSLLQQYLNDREKKPVYLALHHRLDAATSGLILFCKNQNYNKFVTDLFRDKKIQKSYLCIVDVIKELPESSTWKVHNHLKSFKIKHYKLAKSAKQGDEAITEFRLLKAKNSNALIECHPLTGRLHQIRVHLSEMSLPIVGDFHYNKKKSKLPLLLHAYKLSFVHPKTQKTLEVMAPIPDYFFLKADIEV
jgi:23S rRNA pseudouridine1911/1915/1917 synthase